MRLINCSALKLEEFIGNRTPRYAILSHTWEKEEVSFAEFTHDQAAVSDKAGYRKIALTCQQAMKDNIRYAWIDTCCIDKSSSSELSEAINSMFKWYQNAAICYAYLSDVSSAKFATSFSNSRWFTRGWTLQELLAPQDLTFYDQEWTKIGTRFEHVNTIHEITNIDVSALQGPGKQSDIGAFLAPFCIAKRLSWASTRTTTREEDQAYSILGIVDVNIPLLYGEGSHAFRRVQEEIIRKHGDNSILAWGSEPAPPQLVRASASWAEAVLLAAHPQQALAHSPSDFANCWNLEPLALSESAFTTTHIGIHAELPTVRISLRNETVGLLGLLNCSPDPSHALVGIILKAWYRIDERDGKNLMHKVSISRFGEVYTTVLIDPSVAFEAASQSVILRHVKQQSRMIKGSCDKMVISISERLQTIGYDVVSGLEGKVNWTYQMDEAEMETAIPLEESKASWDRESRVLDCRPSTQRLRRTGYSCRGCFIFRGMKGAYSERSSLPKFTVFVFHMPGQYKAIMRRGTTFSARDILLKSHGLLRNPHAYDHNDTITCGKFTYQIKIDVCTKTIYNWNLTNIDVDAIRVDGNPEQPYDLQSP